MRKYLSVFFVFLLALVLRSCTPVDEPGEQIIGAPVFYVKGMVNGKPIDIQAGVNNYRMMPIYERESSGLLVFGARLADSTCASCESLTIKVRNFDSMARFRMDSSFYQGRYEFYNSTLTARTYYEATFYSRSKGAGNPANRWLFGNAESGEGTTVRTRYTESGNYAVTQQSDFYQCSDALTQTIRVPSLYENEYIDINANRVNDSTILFNSVPVDGHVNVEWDFGDGKTAFGPYISHTYETPGYYKVCMKLRKAPDTTGFMHCIRINTESDTACLSNFRYKVKTVNDALQLSGVVVEWQDDSGRLFSSSSLSQPKSMQFTVLERSEYIPASGEGKIVKVKVRFSCDVSDGISTLHLDNVEATMAFSYP